MDFWEYVLRPKVCIKCSSHKLEKLFLLWHVRDHVIWALYQLSLVSEAGYVANA